MTKRLYLIGAGFNHDLIDNNRKTPPMQSDFFTKFFDPSETQIGIYENPVNNLIYAYMDKKIDYSQQNSLSLEYLSNWYSNDSKKLMAFKRNPPNLEEFFTFFEKDPRPDIQNALETFKIGVMNFLAQNHILNDNKKNGHEDQANKSYFEFARLLLEEKPSIITFNYDCILEELLEKQSNLNWKRENHYGIPFAGFINLNESKLCKIRSVKGLELIKPHGSINWIKINDIDMLRNSQIIPLKKIGELVTKEKNPRNRVWFSNAVAPTISSAIVQQILNGAMQPPFSPEMIPPVQQKRYSNQQIYNILWKKAEKAISKAKELIIIGYSLPSTDTRVIDLLKKAHSLKKLIVVNPSEETQKHLEGCIGLSSTCFKNLKDYIENFQK